MHSFNNSCYQFSTANANLATARANCEAMGFHLVYIESSEEQGFLVSMVNDPLPREQWIGIERTAEGERVWMDGSTISYSNFRAGEMREECFQIRQQDAYKWRDHDCDHKHAYICEREQGEYIPNITMMFLYGKNIIHKSKGVVASLEDTAVDRGSRGSRLEYR